MKIKFTALFLILWLLIACEKRIVLHPENSEQKYSVEAILTDFSQASYVRITKSKEIYQPITDYEQITDADVKIIDLTSNDTIVFNYDSNEKTYKTTVSGIEGHTYRLDILAQGQHLTATKTMTSRVSLNRVISVPTNDDPNLYYLKMQFDDPPEPEDYYLIIMQPQNPNSELESLFTVISDKTYNRNEHTISFNNVLFHKDENWYVFFFHIDKKNFIYFQVIQRAMESLVNGAHPFFGVSLGNPQGTIDTEQTLGYFITSPVTVSPIRIGN